MRRLFFIMIFSFCCEAMDFESRDARALPQGQLNLSFTDDDYKEVVLNFQRLLESHKVSEKKIIIPEIVQKSPEYRRLIQEYFQKIEEQKKALDYRAVSLIEDPQPHAKEKKEKRRKKKKKKPISNMLANSKMSSSDDLFIKLQELLINGEDEKFFTTAHQNKEKLNKVDFLHLLSFFLQSGKSERTKKFLNEFKKKISHDHKIAALYIAVAIGNQESVDLILEEKLDLNQSYYEKMPILHFCLAQKTVHKNIVETILKAGADTNQIDEKGHLPLEIAFSMCRVLVPTLINYNADINRINGMGFSPFHFILFYHTDSKDKKKALINHLIKNYKADVNKCLEKPGSSLKVSPLAHAITLEDKVVLEALLENDAQYIKSCEGKGFRDIPMHYAAIVSTPPILELLARKYDVNQVKYNRTPIQLAGVANQRDNVLYLLKLGAKVSMPLSESSEKSDEDLSLSYLALNYGLSQKEV